MSSPTPAAPNEAASSRGWIDLVLICLGGLLMVAGWLVAGVAAAGFGLVMPAVRWFGMRGRPVARALALVPAEVALAHREVTVAAGLVGHAEGVAAVQVVDDLVLEAAAIFAGRPVRGGAQRRYVASRAETMAALASDLHERAEALTAARAEVAGESCTVLLPADSNPDPDTWATVLLVLFAPAFVAWEIAAGLARLLWVLCDGIALRVRTLGRLAVRATGSVRTTVIRTARRWTDVRQRVKASCQEARHRFIAAKVQVRIRLRLARRGLHRRVS